MRKDDKLREKMKERVNIKQNEIDIVCDIVLNLHYKQMNIFNNFKH